MEISSAAYWHVTLSVLFAVAFLITVLFLRPGRHFTSKKKIVCVSALLILAVWSIRMAVGLNGENHDLTDVVSCLIDTIRTFSGDGYKSYVKAVKEFAAAIPGAAVTAQKWFTGYAVGLFVAAPITGGAVVFELVASIFPRIKKAFATICIFREILYFSELNEQSLALAKSIRKNTKQVFLKPIIVFTDVYTDEDEEKSTELTLAARALGAICISDDILHTHIRYFWKKKIFLIDKNEIKNIQTLTALSSEEKFRVLDGAEVYLFSNDDTFTLVGYKIRDALEKEAWYVTEPKIITINGYRNLVRNLLSDIPLYEPMIENGEGRQGSSGDRAPSKRDLNVTIIGAGEIGTEMFLSAYWYGQILNCNLKINVVSQESEEEFIDKINYINTDIFDTCIRVGPSANNTGKTEADKTFENGGHTEHYLRLMKKYPDKNECSDEYFTFRYFQTNIKDDDLDDKLSARLWSDGFRLVDSEYFMVALGSDEDNLTVADKLQRYVSISKLEQAQRRPAVIAYVVYDSDLCRTLNKKTDNSKKLNLPVYMHAFGSLEEVFDVKNVYMEEKSVHIEAIKDAYERMAQRMISQSFDRSQYDHWSDVARALHIKYKVFSAGYIKCSVFDNCESGERAVNNSNAFEKYKRDVLASESSSTQGSFGNITPQMYNDLIWLEHRRWNAFLRVNGFRCPEDFWLYGEKTGSHKNLELKLHPCLVETAAGAVRNDLFDGTQKNDVDCLDNVSIKINEKFHKESNYKAYDAPTGDFNCGEFSEKNTKREMPVCIRLILSIPRMLSSKKKS